MLRPEKLGFFGLLKTESFEQRCSKLAFFLSSTLSDLAQAMEAQARETWLYFFLSSTLSHLAQARETWPFWLQHC